MNSNSTNYIYLFILSFTFQLGIAQQKVILDTDPGYDPDDVGCMAMLHSMATQGECEILGIINSTEFKESSQSISAINYFYNRKAIPVGDYSGYEKKINAPKDMYAYHLAENYPKELKNWKHAVDGVSLYREILASAKDTSITIVIIGTMHNFYGLLKSSSDDFSNKSGIQLVKEKVKLVATMGGNFIDGTGYDRTNWGGADALCEYTNWSCINEERNAMCRYVIDHCPAPFMASGWEVGCGDYHNANYGNVMTGAGLRNLEDSHIVRSSYEYHFKYREGSDEISRHSNDQCALHFAIRGEQDNYTAYRNGDITLTKSGLCKWDSKINRQQGYIQKKKDKDLIAAEIEGLMMDTAPIADVSPPYPPKNLSYTPLKNKVVLKWNPSTDPTKGSWVVGYNIYRNGSYVNMALGTKYTTKINPKAFYEVRAVNTNGIESEPLTIIVK